MTAIATAAAPVKEAPFHVEKVLWVKHWTDRLFSFAITRPASMRFRSGEFVMIGLPAREELGEKKPILRAYSVASPHFADQTHLYSEKKWHRLPFGTAEIAADVAGKPVRIRE